MPSAANKLKVVGAPFFTDSTSYSHTVLKQCPKCGTYYKWDFSYEFLVNGSENEITLTWLEDKEGELQAAAVFETIQAAPRLYTQTSISREILRSYMAELILILHLPALNLLMDQLLLEP